MNYQKISEETKERLNAYLRQKGYKLQGRGNFKGAYARSQSISFNAALGILLKEAGF